MRDKDIIESEVKCYSYTFISLQQIFPNPTKEQIELWNEKFVDEEYEGMITQVYHSKCIEYIRGMINMYLDNK